MKPLLLVLLISIRPVFLLSQTAACADSAENWFAWSKARIDQNEQQGLFEENLSLFAEGHRKGYFYFLHPSIPSSKPYLEFPEFTSLMETDRLLYDSALQVSNTLYQIHLPENFNAAYSYPLVFIFHGGNSNLHRVTKHWNQDYLDSRYLKVYLQSYRHFDSENYSWRSGDPRADRDLLGIFREIQDHYLVDTSRIVLAGISAGANYAIGMALRGILPVQGIIAFCPGLPRLFRTEDLPVFMHTDMKVYVLGGEHDFYLEQQEELMHQLDKLGICCTYEQVKGMGHWYPEDEGNYLLDGLQFITEE